MTTLFTFDGVSTLKSWLICMDAFWVTSPTSITAKKKKRKWTLTGSELKLSGLLNTEFKFYMDSFILECKYSRQSILVAFRGSAKCMWYVSLCLFEIQVTEISALGVPFSPSTLYLISPSALLIPLCPSWPNSIANSGLSLPPSRAPSPEWLVSKTTTYWCSPSKILCISSYYLLNQILIS